MRQHELGPAPWSRHSRKRVGRGDGSGHGSYSGRGQKGQKSRSGPGIAPFFEGGQLPLVRKLPSQRGFTNIFRREYEVVNLKSLKRFAEGTEVTPEILFRAGLVRSLDSQVKVLGDGEAPRGLMVKAHKFSATAQQKIEAAGGKAAPA